ncbi:MAG TPA: low affinity iron permease family protein [Rhizomicrobium sp.]|nr:low affinity iron permease family protein [Rhizomicrobium sp.]
MSPSPPPRRVAGAGAPKKAPRLSPFARFANAVARASGRPLAFFLCCVAIVVWAVTGPIFRYSDTWQLVINTGTTIVTFLMVFLIQNTQNRDGAALQAKLDELILVTRQARNEFIEAEQLPDKELDRIRKDVKDAAGAADKHAEA